MCFPSLNSPEAFKNKTLPREAVQTHERCTQPFFYQAVHSYTNSHFCFFYVAVKALPVLNSLGSFEFGFQSPLLRGAFCFFLAGLYMSLEFLASYFRVYLDSRFASLIFPLILFFLRVCQKPVANLYRKFMLVY